jgi:hypothetical protein
VYIDESSQTGHRFLVLGIGVEAQETSKLTSLFQVAGTSGWRGKVDEGFSVKITRLQTPC